MAMKTKITRYGVAALVLGILSSGATRAQEPAAPPAQTQPQNPQNNVRKAIPWKQFDYTCEGGTRMTVYLRGDLAKIRYQGQAYLMKQTMSADGNRYSDGKVVWWGKGNGGFLQEDTSDGNGKMIAKDCKLDQPLNGEAGSGTVTGTVSYLQRMALPPSAVIQVQLLDVSLADAPANVIAEQKITLGDRQVPVPFTLNFDARKIEEKHSYSVSAKITVDGELRFISDQSYPVLTRGNGSKADVVLKPVGASPK
jgi:putative lipoprotein